MNNLNRRGIRKLLALHPAYKLAKEFGVSIPTFKRYMKGQEPKSRGILEKINAETERLLHAGRDELAVLRKYVNEYANHRVSVDESRRGPDSDVFVLRYAVGEVFARWEAASHTLYLSRVHFLYWLGETCPDHKQIRERLQARDIMAMTRMNLNEGTGCPAATMDVYQIDMLREELMPLQEMLTESASRDDPGQDGRIKTGT